MLVSCHMHLRFFPCTAFILVLGCPATNKVAETGPYHAVDTAPPLPESASPWHCGDGEDNDFDTLIDCEDPDCESSSYCTELVDDGDCSDGEDNDEDGSVDCEDSDCVDSEDCAAPEFEDPDSGQCEDGEDNDGDGLTDCEDDDCEDSEACQEEDDGCEDSELEIDIFGPVAPNVGDSWTVWLRCDGATLIGTLVLRFSPPDFASTQDNQATFLTTGTAEMTVQVGGYRASMDVTVTD